MGGEESKDRPLRAKVSEDDVLEAMKDIGGYLDITPEDFKEIYSRAYRHAFERLASSVRAAELMTKKALSVGMDTPVKEVAALMASSGVSGVPVVDEDGRPAGVISEKDFLRDMGGGSSFMDVVAECLRGKGCLAVSVRALKARDMMSSPAITVTPEATVTEITGTLKGKNINRLPVVDGSGKLVGIVTRGDIIRASGE